MRIVRLKIERFRCVRSAILFPSRDNVYLGPNNVGKTAILEALNLLLSPEVGTRGLIDENDFYLREYRLQAVHTVESNPVAAAAAGTDADTEVHEDPQPPTIRIEAVLTGLVGDDLHEFSSVLVPWNSTDRVVVESAEDNVDPFAGAEVAVRVCFEGWYDPDEDDFATKSFFRADPQLSRDESAAFTTKHKRRIGFLIYRDFRALQRPITIEPYLLFGRLLQSQEATPKQFESVLTAMQGTISPLLAEADFAQVVREYQQELQRYLPLATLGDGDLSFEATDRTRGQVKAAAQLYVTDEIPLPLQKMGAGTRSLAILAILLLIARKRGRGIIALEEPETFLFPHAQRRVLDEVRLLASQTFVTTHSPYVLERMPVDSFQRLTRDGKGAVSTTPLVSDPKTGRQIRERFRRQLSEALLGKGAIVVEEESTRLWILKASALLHDKTFEGSAIQALEVRGVTVVAALGNGDVPEVGALLQRAGLSVIGFVDQMSDNELESCVAKAPRVPLYFHRARGLEDLLILELPQSVVRKTLTSAPYTKHLYTNDQIDVWSADEMTDKSREFFIRHKGYQPFHEWILEQLDADTMPVTFKRIVAMAGGQCGTCSVLSV